MGAMLLADMGAEVVAIDRIESIDLSSPKTPGFDLLRTFARENDDQIRVVGRHTVEWLRIIDDLDIARRDASAPSGPVVVARSFEFEIDQNLVGAARDQRGVPAS